MIRDKKDRTTEKKNNNIASIDYLYATTINIHASSRNTTMYYNDAPTYDSHRFHEQYQQQHQDEELYKTPTSSYCCVKKRYSRNQRQQHGLGGCWCIRGGCSLFLRRFYSHILVLHLFLNNCYSNIRTPNVSFVDATTELLIQCHWNELYSNQIQQQQEQFLSTTTTNVVPARVRIRNHHNNKNNTNNNTNDSQNIDLYNTTRVRIKDCSSSKGDPIMISRKKNKHTDDDDDDDIVYHVTHVTRSVHKSDLSYEHIQITWNGFIETSTSIQTTTDVSSSKQQLKQSSTPKTTTIITTTGFATILYNPWDQSYTGSFTTNDTTYSLIPLYKNNTTSTTEKERTTISGMNNNDDMNDNDHYQVRITSLGQKNDFHDEDKDLSLFTNRTKLQEFLMKKRLYDDEQQQLKQQQQQGNNITTTTTKTTTIDTTTNSISKISLSSSGNDSGGGGTSWVSTMYNSFLDKILGERAVDVPNEMDDDEIDDNDYDPTNSIQQMDFDDYEISNSTNEKKLNHDSVFYENWKDVINNNNDDDIIILNENGLGSVVPITEEGKNRRRTMQQQSQQQRQLATSSIFTTVDILIVVTNRAMCEYAGKTAGCDGSSSTVTGTANRYPMSQRIPLLITQTNNAFRDVDIPVRLRVVNIIFLAPGYDGRPTESTLNIIGYDTNVRYWRRKYGADLVSFITGDNNGSSNVCGIAYLLSYESVTSYTCFDEYVFTHEIGHNFGCRHDRINTPSYQTHPYAHGYQDISSTSSTGSPFRTIMSYQCSPPSYCAVIPYFSADGYGLPDGRPIGNARNNNARMIRENISYIAQFMKTSSTEGTTTTTVGGVARTITTNPSSNCLIQTQSSMKCPTYGTTLMSYKLFNKICSPRCIVNDSVSIKLTFGYKCGSQC